jgi:hypothetical protein
MRQANDPEFRALLRQAREGTITTADVDALNAKMLQCLPRYKGLDIVQGPTSVVTTSIGFKCDALRRP